MGATVSELEFGEAQERPILDRWLAVSRLRPSLVIRSCQTHDFDWFLLDTKGLPLVYVEVKKRRSPLSRFGDAIFPLRKHQFALDVLGSFCIRCFGIVEYGCGTLVEVDLGEAPREVREIRRRDRPGSKAVLHGVYAADQIRVVEGVS